MHGSWREQLLPYAFLISHDFVGFCQGNWRRESAFKWYYSPYVLWSMFSCHLPHSPVLMLVQHKERNRRIGNTCFISDDFLGFFCYCFVVVVEEDIKLLSDISCDIWPRSSCHHCHNGVSAWENALERQEYERKDKKHPFVLLQYLCHQFVN